MRDEKMHAVVAQSTFPSQNVQSTPDSEHFWKLRCRKSVRCCGAKHISKSKVSKLKGLDHFWTVRFGQMSFCVAGAGDCAPCEKWAQREGFVAVSTTITKTRRYTTLHYTTLRYTTLHNTPLHYTYLRHTTLLTLHCTTSRYTTLHYIRLHYTTLHYT